MKLALFLPVILHYIQDTAVKNGPDVIRTSIAFDFIIKNTFRMAVLRILCHIFVTSHTHTHTHKVAFLLTCILTCV